MSKTSWQKTGLEFRNLFIKENFLNFDCFNAYELRTKGNNKVCSIELDGKSIESEALLFDVPSPNFSFIEDCRKEIKLLKQLLDFSCLVQTSFEEWKSTLWIEIDVENMDTESKKFVKYVKSLDKEMKEWDLYKGLELTIKNMLTCLRAIGELQNPAIQDRHWEQ